MQWHHDDIFAAARLTLRSFFRLLTEKEQVEFDRTIGRDDRFRRESVISKVRVSSTFDTQEAYQQFKARTHRPRRLRVYRLMRVAALFTILLSASIAFRFFHEDRTPVSIAYTIRPVSSIASITLADGRQVALSGEIGVLTEKNGVRITREAGKITYLEENEKKDTRLIYNKLNVPRGGEYVLLLADGSRVWLNSESELKYPVSFTTQKREVFLSGEAYFEVSENKEKPFIVHTSRGSVKVLGTAFNVRDYNDEKRVVTTLAEGSVYYQNDSRTERSVVLHPGYQVSDAPDDRQLKVEAVDLKEFTGWKDGLYIFKNLTLEEMMKTIERNYDVSVFFTNEEIKKLRFSGDLQKYGKIEDFLKFIEIGGDVTFTIKAKTVTVNQK